MSTKTTKEHIIRKGAELVYLKGYNNTGIQEILQAAKVPKGSFYFYFKNKEEFGLSLIDYFSSFILHLAGSRMRDGGVDPIDGLRSFFEMFMGFMEKQNYTCGCPIGNIAQEMSDLSEAFRDRIAGFFKEAKSLVRTYIEEARKSGRLGTDRDPEMLSDFIFNSWEGALIDMKVSKSARPLDVFMNTVFGMLLK
jgi:TetR/AcrR family transcriptional regulator, transcriptional repressor for nem operon